VTVAIALRDGEDVWLAADGRTLLDGSAWAPCEKVFVLPGELPIGVATCGRHRAAEEIQRRWTPPEYGGDPDAYVYDLAASLEEHFKDEHLWKMLREEDDSAIDAAIMLAFAGRAWVIGGDFTVTPVRPGSYLAMGCASGIASGAMFAARGRSPHARLQPALRAAEAHDVHIGPPWMVVKIPSS